MRMGLLKLIACHGWLAAIVTGHSLQAGELSPGQIVTNSLGMKFAWIPPGTFMMGSPKEERERNKDETQHRVTLTMGFYMGIHTVTQEQWTAILGNNPSKFQGEPN